MKQANEKGGKVWKGEKSTLIVFWKSQAIQTETDDGENTEKTIHLLRYYLVWNVEQCDGLELSKLETRKIDVIAQAEAIVAAMPNPPKITHDGGTRAFYRPQLDSIHLPQCNSFDGAGEYYSTLFHELSYSTGHQSRLNRQTLNEVVPLGSETYSREELVAEFGAAFLCSHAGIENTIDNSASYINGWLKALRNDRRMVIVAAGQAQRAADYILNRRTPE